MAGNIYDTIVDGTSIDAALGASGTILVKSGTYSSDATITVDQANTLLKIEPGTIINANTGGLVISAANCQIEVGPGCTIDNNASAGAISITISGTDCSLRFKNGCVIGNIDITTGERTSLHGGGWGTIIESVVCAGDDCIIKCSAWDSNASTTGLDAISIAGSANGRCQVLYNKVTDSDVDGIGIDDPDCLLLGNIILDAEGIGINVQGLRSRIIGNAVQTAVVGDDISSSSAGDNSVIVANHCVGLIDLLAGGEDIVVTGNRAGSISDATTTSTVQFNDLGTASCAVTGTLQSAGALESEIVSGGKTLILTLTAASWRNQTAAVLATAFQALLTGDHSEANDWDAEKTTILASGTVVRTSATVMTITLAAAASFSITTTDEIVTLAVLDETVLESETTITPNDVSYTITEGS